MAPRSRARMRMARLQVRNSDDKIHGVATNIVSSHVLSAAASTSSAMRLTGRVKVV